MSVSGDRDNIEALKAHISKLITERDAVTKLPPAERFSRYSVLAKEISMLETILAELQREFDPEP
jgi:hypothetical protein